MCSGGRGDHLLPEEHRRRRRTACARTRAACSSSSVASNIAGMCQPSSTTEKATKLGTGLPSARLKRAQRRGALPVAEAAREPAARRPAAGSATAGSRVAASTNSGAATTISSTCWIMCTQKSSALSRSIGEASAIASTARLAVEAGRAPALRDALALGRDRAPRAEPVEDGEVDDEHQRRVERPVPEPRRRCRRGEHYRRYSVTYVTTPIAGEEGPVEDGRVEAGRDQPVGVLDVPVGGAPVARRARSSVATCVSSQYIVQQHRDQVEAGPARRTRSRRRRSWGRSAAPCTRCTAARPRPARARRSAIPGASQPGDLAFMPPARDDRERGAEHDADDERGAERLVGVDVRGVPHVVRVDRAQVEVGEQRTPGRRTSRRRTACARRPTARARRRPAAPAGSRCPRARAGSSGRAAAFRCGRHRSGPRRRRPAAAADGHRRAVVVGVGVEHRDLLEVVDRARASAPATRCDFECHGLASAGSRTKISE